MDGVFGGSTRGRGKGLDKEDEGRMERHEGG